jgi:predicted PurR-regulated permease PerM
MNFLEIAVFIAVAFVLYLILVPLQRRLEWRIYKIFRSNSKSKKTTIVDVTDSIKKEKPDAK